MKFMGMVLLLLLTTWFAFGVETEVPLPERGICAHRGASSVYPENTLPAFEEAARLGAHMIEFDVYLTKDGEPVVMHDSTVDRTTDGHGKIGDLTLAEIKALDAGFRKGAQFKGVTVPTMEEALAVMPLNVWLNVHLKEGAEAGRKTAEILAKAGRIRQAVLACDIDAAQAAKEVVPNLKICNMERQWTTGISYVDLTIDLKTDFIQLAIPVPPDLADQVRRLKEHHIRINFFGLENPADLRMLYKAGVDFPLVNDVAVGLKTAAEFGIEPWKPVFPNK